jgi:hypothetical protein
MADTVEVDSSLIGENVDRNSHFSPDLSNVLNMILKVSKLHLTCNSYNVIPTG